MYPALSPCFSLSTQPSLTSSSSYSSSSSSSSSLFAVFILTVYPFTFLPTLYKVLALRLIGRRILAHVERARYKKLRMGLIVIQNNIRRRKAKKFLFYLRRNQLRMVTIDVIDLPPVVKLKVKCTAPHHHYYYYYYYHQILWSQSHH